MQSVMKSPNMTSKIGRIPAMAAPMAMPKAPDSEIGVLKPLLLDGRAVISTTASTKFGEFSLQYRAGRELSLWIPMETSGECIEVPLLPGAVESN
jgi:hypothetical protein